MASRWADAWGTSWGVSWDSAVAPSVVIYGGDDAPGKKRKKEKPYDLFREIEATVHALLHPAPVVEAEHESPPVLDTGAARRAVDELLVLAQGQHALLQRASKLQAELAAFEAEQRRLIDEEDEFLLMMS